jgi:organic hydroperoxide reductase OsmC/OhrA
VARFAPLYDVAILDAAADVRATFFNTEKYDVDDAPPYFEQVTVKLEIDSPASAEPVAELVRHAERACHAAQSLRHPVDVTLSATLNGTPLA